MKFPYQKTVALAMVLTFISTSILPQGWSAPVEVSPAPPVFDLKIPENLASVDTLFSGRGPAVLHIQTAHGNFEAQKKIQSLLHYLDQRYGFKNLFVEGSPFELTPKALRFLPERRDLTMKINETLARESIVKGSELYLVESKDAKAYGIENLETYKANGEAFKAVLSAQPKTQKFIQALDLQIERLSSAFLNKDLRAALSRLEGFQEGRLDFASWLAELNALALKHLKLELTNARSQTEWPMLTRYFKVLEWEKKAEPAALALEKERFLNLIKKFPQAVQIKELLEFRSQETDSPETLERLVESLALWLPKNFDAAAYPNLNRRIGIRLLQSEIQGKPLGEEVDRLTDRVLAGLSQGEKEEKVLEALKDYRRLHQLFRLELTPSDYEMILAKKENLTPSRMAARFREMNTQNRVQNLNFEHLSELDDLYQKALEFYRFVKQRDQIMLQNFTEKMKEKHIEKAVVITGGFHSGPFERYFHDAGANYALLSPKITQTPAEGERQAYIDAVFQENPKIIKATYDTPSIALPRHQLAQLHNLSWLDAQIQSAIRSSSSEGVNGPARFAGVLRSETRDALEDLPAAQLLERVVGNGYLFRSAHPDLNRLGNSFIWDRVVYEDDDALVVEYLNAHYQTGGVDQAQIILAFIPKKKEIQDSFKKLEEENVTFQMSGPETSEHYTASLDSVDAGRFSFSESITDSVRSLENNYLRQNSDWLKIYFVRAATTEKRFVLPGFGKPLQDRSYVLSLPNEWQAPEDQLEEPAADQELDLLRRTYHLSPSKTGLTGEYQKFSFEIGAEIPGVEGRPVLITHLASGKKYFHPRMNINVKIPKGEAFLHAEFIRPRGEKVQVQISTETGTIIQRSEDRALFIPSTIQRSDFEREELGKFIWGIFKLFKVGEVLTDEKTIETAKAIVPYRMQLEALSQELGEFHPALIQDPDKRRFVQLVLRVKISRHPESGLYLENDAKEAFLQLRQLMLLDVFHFSNSGRFGKLLNQGRLSLKDSLEKGREDFVVQANSILKAHQENLEKGVVGDGAPDRVLAQAVQSQIREFLSEYFAAPGEIEAALFEDAGLENLESGSLADTLSFLYAFKLWMGKSLQAQWQYRHRQDENSSLHIHQTQIDLKSGPLWINTTLSYSSNQISTHVFEAATGKEWVLLSEDAGPGDLFSELEALRRHQQAVSRIQPAAWKQSLISAYQNDSEYKIFNNEYQPVLVRALGLLLPYLQDHQFIFYSRGGGGFIGVEVQNPRPITAQGKEARGAELKSLTFSFNDRRREKLGYEAQIGESNFAGGGSHDKMIRVKTQAEFLTRWQQMLETSRTSGIHKGARPSMPVLELLKEWRLKAPELTDDSQENALPRSESRGPVSEALLQTVSEQVQDALRPVLSLLVHPDPVSPHQKFSPVKTEDLKTLERQNIMAAGAVIKRMLVEGEAVGKIAKTVEPYFTLLFQGYDNEIQKVKAGESDRNLPNLLRNYRNREILSEHLSEVIKLLAKHYGVELKSDSSDDAGYQLAAPQPGRGGLTSGAPAVSVKAKKKKEEKTPEKENVFLSRGFRGLQIFWDYAHPLLFNWVTFMGLVGFGWYLFYLREKAEVFGAKQDAEDFKTQIIMALFNLVMVIGGLAVSVLPVAIFKFMKTHSAMPGGARPREAARPIERLSPDKLKERESSGGTSEATDDDFWGDSRRSEAREPLSWNDETEILERVRIIMTRWGWPMPRKLLVDGDVKTPEVRPLNIIDIKDLAKDLEPNEYLRLLNLSADLLEYYSSFAAPFLKRFGILPSWVVWFRYQQQLRDIQDQIQKIPAGHEVRILVHAAWNGEDAYAIAMMLDLFFPERKFELVISDFSSKPNPENLEWVRADSIPDFFPPEARRYFTEKTPEILVFHPERLGKNITIKIQQGDLRDSASFGKNLDIVVANAVLGQSLAEEEGITQSVQNALNALKPGGRFYSDNSAFQRHAHQREALKKVIRMNFQKFFISNSREDIFTKRSESREIHVQQISLMSGQPEGFFAVPDEKGLLSIRFLIKFDESHDLSDLKDKVQAWARYSLFDQEEKTTAWSEAATDLPLKDIKMAATNNPYVFKFEGKIQAPAANGKMLFNLRFLVDGKEAWMTNRTPDNNAVLSFESAPKGWSYARVPQSGVQQLLEFERHFSYEDEALRWTKDDFEQLVWSERNVAEIILDENQRVVGLLVFVPERDSVSVFRRVIRFSVRPDLTLKEKKFAEKYLIYRYKQRPLYSLNVFVTYVPEEYEEQRKLWESQGFTPQRIENLYYPGHHGYRLTFAPEPAPGSSYRFEFLDHKMAEDYWERLVFPRHKRRDLAAKLFGGEQPEAPAFFDIPAANLRPEDINPSALELVELWKESTEEQKQAMLERVDQYDPQFWGKYADGIRPWLLWLLMDPDYKVRKKVIEINDFYRETPQGGKQGLRIDPELLVRHFREPWISVQALGQPILGEADAESFFNKRIMILNSLILNALPGLASQEAPPDFYETVHSLHTYQERVSVLLKKMFDDEELPAFLQKGPEKWMLDILEAAKSDGEYAAGQARVLNFWEGLFIAFARFQKDHPEASNPYTSVDAPNRYFFVSMLHEYFATSAPQMAVLIAMTVDQLKYSHDFVQGFGVWSLGPYSVTEFGAAVISGPGIWQKEKGKLVRQENGLAVPGGIPLMLPVNARTVAGNMIKNDGTSVNVLASPLARAVDSLVSGEKHQLHGFTDKVQWRVEAANQNSITLSINSRDVALKVEGAKTLADIIGNVSFKQTYKAEPNKLISKLEIKNLEKQTLLGKIISFILNMFPGFTKILRRMIGRFDKRVVLGGGYHPFYQVENIEDWMIQIPANQYWTGDAVPLKADATPKNIRFFGTDFRQFAPLRYGLEIVLSNFTPDADGNVSIILMNKKTGEQKRFTFPANDFSALLLWVPPQDKAPAPGIFSIEPLFSVPNGRNLFLSGNVDAKPLVLQPGETHTASWTYETVPRRTEVRLAERAVVSLPAENASSLEYGFTPAVSRVTKVFRGGVLPLRTAGFLNLRGELANALDQVLGAAVYAQPSASVPAGGYLKAHLKTQAPISFSRKFLEDNAALQSKIFTEKAWLERISENPRALFLFLKAMRPEGGKKPAVTVFLPEPELKGFPEILGRVLESRKAASGAELEEIRILKETLLAGGIIEFKAIPEGLAEDKALTAGAFAEKQAGAVIWHAGVSSQLQQNSSLIHFSSGDTPAADLPLIVLATLLSRKLGEQTGHLALTPELLKEHVARFLDQSLPGFRLEHGMVSPFNLGDFASQAAISQYITTQA